MKLNVKAGDIASTKADVIIVNLFEGVKSPGGGTGAVDSVLGGILSQEIKASKTFTGKLGETLVLPTYKKLSASHVIIVGLGKSNKLGNLEIRRASAAAIRACQKLKASSVATILHGAGIGGFDTEAAARLVAEGSLLGSYQFLTHKTASKKNPPVPIKFLTVVEFDKKKITAIKKGLALGEKIAKGVNLARDLVFDGSNHVTPETFKSQAQRIARKAGVTCTILNKKTILSKKMGAFYSVAKASDYEGYLIHLAYKPKKKAKKKIAFVGKGITFDSGGYSLKPPKSQELMKMDMAGAAAVLATMSAVSEIGGLNVEVHCFIGTCENMVNGTASKPGDVVKAYNGKTIEINNTDAEGRLVLADTMTYAQKQIKPDVIMDIATLTGAQVVALGQVASAIMGNDDKLVASVIDAGKNGGEKLWQMPLYDEFKDFLKSDVADIKNAGSGGQAGTCAAGTFLNQFIEDKQTWCHLDIAGPAYTSSDVAEVPKGATGVGVRTFLYYLYGLN